MSEARKPAFALLLAGALGAGGCTLVPEKPEPIPAPVDRDTADTGRVGDAITVLGQETELRVRVQRVRDPVPSGSDRPLRPGARFVGIEVRIENIGEGRYSASPLGDAELLTDRGPADPTTLLFGPCAKGFTSHVNLAPGDGRDGCLTFEARPGAELTEFRYALDSGFAPEVGTWKLG